MTSALTHHDFVHHLGAFALAQVFWPHEVATCAAQVLLPAEDVPAEGRGIPTQAWISVEALIERLGMAGYTAVYEVVAARLARWLQHCSVTWPPLWREAVAMHFFSVYGVALANETQLQALDQEAHDALWEAHQALYGAPNGCL